MDNPILKESAGADVSKHIGYFMWNDTFKSYVLPRSAKTGTFVRILSKTEEEAIGKIIDRNLSIYAKDDNFWTKFRVKIAKEDVITTDGKITGKVFDMSNPFDFLAVKVLEVCGEVKPSMEHPDRGEYSFVLVDESYQDKTELVRAETNLEIYSNFSKMAGSTEQMSNFLSVYWLHNEKATKPPANATIAFLKAEIERLIAIDAKGILKLMTDPYLEYKYKVHKAIMLGAIKRSKTTKTYELPDSRILGTSLDDVITFFRDERNTEEWLRVEAQLELAESRPRKETKTSKGLVE